MSKEKVLYRKDSLHSIIDYPELIKRQSEEAFRYIQNGGMPIKKAETRNYEKPAVKVKTNNPKVARRNRSYGGK